jgi:hypothetical protein
VRAAALALIGALLGAAAALGLGRAFGLVGGSTTETVIVRAAAPAHDRVIGINAQIRSDQGNGSGIGPAVPAGAARRALPSC